MATPVTFTKLTGRIAAWNPSFGPFPFTTCGRDTVQGCDRETVPGLSRQTEHMFYLFGWRMHWRPHGSIGILTGCLAIHGDVDRVRSLRLTNAKANRTFACEELMRLAMCRYSKTGRTDPRHMSMGLSLRTHGPYGQPRVISTQ